MISSRFNRHLSIWAEGRDLWLAGVPPDGDHPYIEIQRAPNHAPIIGIQYVREGEVHIVLADRSVYRFGRTVDPQGLVLEKLGHLP